MAGHREPLAALHGVGFNIQHIASRGSPRQPHHHSRLARAFHHFGLQAEARDAEEIVKIVGSHQKLIRAAFRHLPRLLSAHGRNFPLQVPHPGLPGVVPDDVRQGGPREFNLVGRFDAVLLRLLSDQVANRDLNLFFLAVTLELENLHAVEQGRRNRIQHIRGADE